MMKLVVLAKKPRADYVEVLTHIQMSVDAGVSTCAHQRQARGLGRVTRSYAVTPRRPMVSQSQVGHVDHIAPLARAEQEVFWFDVAVMVVSCVQTLNPSEKLIHQH